MKKFSLAEYHYRSEEQILISYKGPFEKEVLRLIGIYLRKLHIRNAGARRRIFKVFIEMAQNISYYSAEKNIIGSELGAGVGSLVLLDHGDHYLFITGNMIRKEDIPVVMDRFEVISKLDREKLRQLKREHLARESQGRQGADIGLIQLAISSDGQLDIEVAGFDRNNSFITISVKLNK